ncbi:MAG TPA: hypothetical protein VF324_08980 [Methanobacterium sp.]
MNSVIDTAKSGGFELVRVIQAKVIKLGLSLTVVPSSVTDIVGEKIF